MEHETVEGAVRARLEDMQANAVKNKWLKVHPEWNELNRKREILGMKRVSPIDRPSKEHFE